MHSSNQFGGGTWKMNIGLHVIMVLTEYKINLGWCITNNALSYTESNLIFHWCSVVIILPHISMTSLGLENNFMDNEVLGKMKNTYSSGLSMASLSFVSPSFIQTQNGQAASILKLGKGQKKIEINGYIWNLWEIEFEKFICFLE